MVKDLSAHRVCELHESYAAKVNRMWGGVITIGVLGGMGLAIAGAIIADTRDILKENQENCRAAGEASVQRDQKIAERFLDIANRQMIENNNIIRVLNTISINQKVVMKHLDLEYMSPEWVRHYDDTD